MADKDEQAKIIIDEDWKSKVDREREEARKPAPGDTPESKGKSQPDDVKLTLFDFLVSSLAAQTVMALGLAAEEGQKQVYVDLGAARHLIDTLIVLREKTKGNLTQDEDANLSEAIAELQRVFAVRATQVREASLNRPPADPNMPSMNPEKK
jgi:hypothetical protein